MLFVMLRRKLYFITFIVISSLGLFILLPGKKSETLSEQPADSKHSRDSSNIVSFKSAITSEKFNISGDSLFVLLHIQKTGGTTFERHLVQDILLDLPCSCSSESRRCSCPRRRSNERRLETLSDLTWIISRFSTGWICGLHPDLSQLKRCLVEARKLYFLTILRDPLHRFISEYRHVRRGATWKTSKSHCRQYDTQLCYRPRPDWSNATLEEFLSCPHNMAVNRQTRMLASYNLSTTCSASISIGDGLLSSAKENLEQLAYFGICEQQRSSQILFEKTFNHKFKIEFNQSEDNKTRLFISELPRDVINRILEANSLDVQLYDHAVNLFAKRCNMLTNSSKCSLFG